MKSTSYVDKPVFTTDQGVDSEDYWLDKLAGNLEKTGFPYDHKRIEVNENVPAVMEFRLTDSLYSRLLKLSNESFPRLHMILIAAVISLLFKYSGNKDIIVGTTIYKQEIETEFINTVLALRNQLHDTMTFKELLLQLRETMIEAEENQNYPVELLIQKLKIPFSKDDYFPLFDVAILLENIQNKCYIQSIKPNVLFFFAETGEGLEGVVEYNSSLYERKTIGRIIVHLRNLLQAVLFNLDLETASIDILTEEEKKQLLFEINNTRVTYPRDKTIHELIEGQMEKTPDRTAVVGKKVRVGKRFVASAAGEENTHVTYSKLNQKSNQLASVLREKGVSPDDIVGIMMARSIEMITAILGILKSGGAYLPIFLYNPGERTRFMLLESNTKIVVTSRTYKIGEEINFVREMVYIDDIEENLLNPGKVVRVSTPKNLAYVIYTSGTTGRPKGVSVDHQGLVNYICWARKKYVKDEKTDFPLYTSISFDMTVTSIFTPLITGNAIVVYKGEDRETLIEEIIDDNKIGLVKATPSHLKLIRNKQVKHSSIKRFIVGGENLETQLASDIFQNFNEPVEIYNEYGPTETVVGCMIYKFHHQKDTGESVPIGIPIDNVQIYLLDRNMKPVPEGAVGEICISGDCTARGYLNRPELTNEKFVRNSFVPGQKIYKTGDLGRWLPGGNLEFHGRADQQIKIRGFRIELAEIENQLLKHPQIKNALVLANEKEPGDKYLCAYAVPYQKIEELEVKEFLSDKLPYYMIPTYILYLDRIPLTPNGKLDLKNLPEPQVKIKQEYIPPGNSKEEKLAEIWSEILGMEKSMIGINHNFFELGGHSLKATIMVAKIHKEINVKLLLTDVFDKPTIRELAQHIKNVKEDEYLSVKIAEKQEFYALSSAQRRLYIMQQVDSTITAYNISNILTLHGELNKDKLKQTFKKLIYRHESLRTSFETIVEEPVQRIHDEVEFQVENYELTCQHIHIIVEDTSLTQSIESTIIKNFIRPFELSRAPLIRVGLIQLEEKEHILIVDMHHIITDGVSHNILIGDFVSLYEGRRLSALRLQYKDFSRWQTGKAMKQSMNNQKAYWLTGFAGHIPRLNLNGDYERSNTKSFVGDSVPFVIGSDLNQQVKKLTEETGTTLFMVLLTVYYILISCYSHQEDIVVGSPIIGRRHADLQHIVGMFVNMLALRSQPAGHKTFKGFLAEVKQNALDAYENQDYQFEQLIVDLDLQGAVDRNPLFDVVFSMQKTDVDIKADTGRIFIPIEHLEIIPYPFKKNTTPFDFLMSAYEMENAIDMNLNYSTQLFKRSTAEKITRHYTEILEQVVKNKYIKLQDIQISYQLEELKSDSFLQDKGDFGF